MGGFLKKPSRRREKTPVVRALSCRQNIGLIPRRNRSPFLGTSENVETKTAKESCDLSGNRSRSPNKTRQQPNIVPSSPILHAYGDDRGRLVVTTPTLATAAVAPPLTPSSKAGPPKTKLTVTAPRAREDPPPNPWCRCRGAFNGVEPNPNPPLPIFQEP